MKLVVCIGVPMADGMRAERRHSHDERYAQQAYSDSVPHHNPNSSPEGMLAEMHFGQQASLFHAARTRQRHWVTLSLWHRRWADDVSPRTSVESDGGPGTSQFPRLPQR